MPSPRIAVPVALAATLLSPAVVRADAIMGPPACPPGARGDSSHSGEWCAPWTCTSDADCGGAATCRPWRVCTRASDVQPGGLRAEPAPVERMNLVVGTCDPAAKCRGDEEPPPPLVGTIVAGAPECREAQHCVGRELPGLPAPTGVVTPPPGAGTASSTSTPPPQTGTPPSGCGCNEGSRPGGLALLVGWLVVRRRRRAA